MRLIPLERGLSMVAAVWRMWFWDPQSKYWRKEPFIIVRPLNPSLAIASVRRLLIKMHYTVWTIAQSFMCPPITWTPTRCTTRGDVRPLGAKNTETADLNVTPAETTADVAWPAVSGAATYELVIKDKSGNVICTLIFNAQGQLTQIAFNAPSRNNAPQQTQAAGFSFTVTGLEEGTSYDLTITSKDNNGGTLDTKTVSFTTTGEPQGIEDVLSDQVQCTKVIRDGQVFILRGEKVYNAQGALVKYHVTIYRPLPAYFCK